MIFPSTPSRAAADNGVRIRVAACRKRLRDSRTTHRSTNHFQLSQQNSELAPFSVQHRKDRDLFLEARRESELIEAYGAVGLSENGDVEEAGIP